MKILSATLLTLATLAIIPTSARADDLVGTWKNLQESRTWTFMPSGQVRSDKPETPFPMNGQWIQAGANVAFTMTWNEWGTNWTSAYAGVIGNDTMRITYVRSDGVSETFTLQKTD